MIKVYGALRGDKMRIKASRYGTISNPSTGIRIAGASGRCACVDVGAQLGCILELLENDETITEVELWN